ncbi:DoxX family protein [Paenibacillus sp. SAF-054]|uniref:DoxX family protein n=1 Tax=unclassified Paenibacillus TaxID=185978 RepID=UPI003F7DB399
MFIILQILLAIVFLMTGFMKLSGSKVETEIFENLKLPPWLKVFTGIIQLLAGVGLIVGIWVYVLTFWVSLGIAIMMFGAMLSHVRAKDPVKIWMIPFILMIISIIMVWHNTPYF